MAAGLQSRTLSFALVLAGLGVGAFCQTARRPAARPNVQAGTLAAIDTAGGTITLHPRTGADVVYRLTERTRILRQKKTAAPDALQVKDEVVVRFRRSSVGPPTLYDLADRASWEWLDRIRHETTPVTLKAAEEGLLRAAEGADAAEIEYRVTEKTRWARKGAPAPATEFKPGEKVWVTPRLLPSGAVMAVAVADTPEMAARLKERSRAAVTGVLKTVDAQKRALSLHTIAGDDRDLLLSPECIVRQASRDVPLTALRPGQTVTAHVRRDAAGDETVARLTIQAKRPTVRTAPPVRRP